MAFEASAINIIALITAILILVKMLFLAFSPTKYSKFVSSFMKNAKAWQVAYLIMAVIVLYYLLPELGIVAIMAVLLLASMLMGTVLFSYPKKMLTGIVKEVEKTKPWFTIVIYATLAIWTLIVLF